MCSKVDFSTKASQEIQQKIKANLNVKKKRKKKKSPVKRMTGICCFHED